MVASLLFYLIVILFSVRIILVLDQLKDNPRYEGSFFMASHYHKFDDKVNLSTTMSYRERVISFCKCMRIE